MAKKSTDNKVTTATKSSTDLLKRLMKATGNEYGAVASDGLASDITEWTDTGCYLWNMQVSADLFRGIPNGKVTGFAGPSGTMKTYACISVIKNFLDKNDEARVFIFDSENAITQSRLTERKVDLSRVAHLPIGSLPEFRTQCYNLLKEINAEPANNTRYMIVLDSLGNLPSAREIKNAQDGHEAADFTRSKDIRSIFRTLTVMLSRKQIPMLVTNHSYANIAPMSHGEIMAGGGGLKFAADIIVMFTKAQYKEGEDRAGSIISSTLEKGRDSKEKTKVKMLLHYTYGLHPYWGLLEWLEKSGIAKREGNKYLVGDKKYSEKEIYIKGSEVFTKDVLDRLNNYMKPFFSYGGEVTDTIPDGDGQIEEIEDADSDE